MKHDVNLPDEPIQHEVSLSIPESVHDTIEAVKLHFEENKMTYLVGAGCFAAGYFLRGSQMSTPPVVINNIFAPVPED